MASCAVRPMMRRCGGDDGLFVGGSALERKSQSRCASASTADSEQDRSRPACSLHSSRCASVSRASLVNPLPSVDAWSAIIYSGHEAALSLSIAWSVPLISPPSLVPVGSFSEICNAVPRKKPSHQHAGSVKFRPRALSVLRRCVEWPLANAPRLSPSGPRRSTSQLTGFGYLSSSQIAPKSANDRIPDAFSLPLLVLSARVGAIWVLDPNLSLPLIQTFPSTPARVVVVGAPPKSMPR